MYDLGLANKSLDIETAPKPLEEIIHLRPEFTAPSNWKDPEKIRASIAEQETNWLQKAALSPLTGRVLVIGIKPFGPYSPIYLEGDERDMLLEFWQIVGKGVEFDKWHGHNIGFFDLPFLVKRSWLHGIEVPLGIVFNGRYINERRFVDTMTTFQCGNRQEFVSLDTVAKFFGLAGKPDSISANFAEVYAVDRPRALLHLQTDLELVEAVATRMFVYRERAA